MPAALCAAALPVLLSTGARAEDPARVQTAVQTAVQAGVQATPPRTSGWWVGDRLTHEALFLPPPGMRPDPASLPRPRAVTYWLDLISVSLDQTTLDGRPAYRLRSIWQSFYAPMEPTVLEVPGLDLTFRPAPGSDAPALTVQAPGWSFTTSPLLPLRTPATAQMIAPDAPADPRPEAPLWRRVAAMAGLCLMALGLLAHGQGWPPFARGRRDLPLTRAHHLARRAGDETARALALHRGLDGANGGPLLAADLPGFLLRHPEFRPLATDLADFFDRSTRAFFGETRISGDSRRLIRQLAAIERGRR